MNAKVKEVLQTLFEMSRIEVVEGKDKEKYEWHLFNPIAFVVWAIILSIFFQLLGVGPHLSSGG